MRARCQHFQRLAATDDEAAACDLRTPINRINSRHQSTQSNRRPAKSSHSFCLHPSANKQASDAARQQRAPARRHHHMTLAGLRIARVTTTTALLASIAAGGLPARLVASAAFVSSSSSGGSSTSCSNGSSSGGGSSGSGGGRSRGLSSMSATHRVSRNDAHGGKGVAMTPIAGPPSSTIIWLHGLGDSGEGWAGAFDPSKFPSTKMIFPTAPTRPITLNGGFPMPGWFDINGLDETSPEDHAGFAEAQERIEKIIQGEVAAGVPAEKIVLGGFSQGGAVTLHVCLRSTTRLAGGVILSGWLPLKAEYPAALTDVGKSLSYFHGHGDADGIVRYSWGQHSAQKLKEMGVDSYRFETYKGLDHGATPEELATVVEFVKGLIQ